MPLYGPDAFVKRAADGFTLTEQWQAENRASLVTLWSTSWGGQLLWKYVVPSMPTGVDKFIPSTLHWAGQGGYIYYVVRYLLGTLDISGASGTFTDGVAMPTMTELGVSRQIPGALIMEVDTALNATPGTITVTYKDENGNAAETTGGQALGVSSQPRSLSPVTLIGPPDYNVTDVTTAARSGGTTPTGVIKLYGCLPLGQKLGVVQSYSQVSLALLGDDYNPFPLAAGAEIAAIQVGQQTIAHAIAGYATFLGDTA